MRALFWVLSLLDRIPRYGRVYTRVTWTKSVDGRPDLVEPWKVHWRYWRYGLWGQNIADERGLLDAYLTYLEEKK